MKYWRVYAGGEAPRPNFPLPARLAAYASPPKRNDRILVASYDPDERMGLVSQLGIIQTSGPETVIVDWRECHAEIWVDTSKGHGFWQQADGFAFASKKITDYGLRELFDQSFDLAPPTPIARHSAIRRTKTTTSSLTHERTHPIEIVGSRTGASRGGVVYLLKSAYGYKVGRTRNIPDRMRAFGVKLPFFYTIPLCAWFDDCVEAESRYHQLFSAQRINGEWFDLTEPDIDLIRDRVFERTDLNRYTPHSG